MTYEQVMIGIVSEQRRDRLVSIVEAHGAAAEICTEANAIAKAPSLDAIVFDVGQDPTSLVPMASILAQEPRSRWLPRLLITPQGIPADLLVPFGLAGIVGDDTGLEGAATAIADVIARVRATGEVERRLGTSIAELHAAEKRLLLLQKEGSTLAHDARVLFGVILGFASNLRDGIVGSVTESQRSSLATIMEASTDAASLFDRYTAVLRDTVRESEATQKGVLRDPPRRRQHDLADLVRSTVALFGGVAAAKNIRLTTSAERAAPSWCDAMRIKQALVNLLANALKFTPAGGAVEVAVRVGVPASVRGASSPRRELEIVVSDTGPGIPRSERERIFQRGVRLERDAESPGSGIGLSVVRDVVELHGGVVTVEDGYEGGASFVMTLPADLRARAADVNADGAANADANADESGAVPISTRFRLRGTTRDGAE